MSARGAQGQYGELQVIVIPKVMPRAGHVVMVDVKPLSLHRRCAAPTRCCGAWLGTRRPRSVVDGGADDRPMNALRLSGPFTLMQMQEWVGACLPDLPGRCVWQRGGSPRRGCFCVTPHSVSGDEVKMCFRNAMLGSQVRAARRRGGGVAGVR